MEDLPQVYFSHNVNDLSISSYNLGETEAELALKLSSRSSRRKSNTPRELIETADLYYSNATKFRSCPLKMYRAVNLSLNSAALFAIFTDDARQSTRRIENANSIPLATVNRQAINGNHCFPVSLL